MTRQNLPLVRCRPAASGVAMPRNRAAPALARDLLISARMTTPDGTAKRRPMQQLMMSTTVVALGAPQASAAGLPATPPSPAGGFAAAITDALAQLLGAAGGLATAGGRVATPPVEAKPVVATGTMPQAAASNGAMVAS